MLRRLAIPVLLAAAPAAAEIDIIFDYSRDTNNFFDVTSMAVLESAASVFEARFLDELDAITSAGSNQFNARFTHPGDGTLVTINDFSVNAGEIIVFAGGRQLGSTLGAGGPGGFTGSGSGAFLDTFNRGQAGYLVDGGPDTDFGPWGGSITFDIDNNWFFDTDPSTIEPFAGQDDFFSVALHELGHVLGLGTADSWDALISGGNFTGASAVAEFGGNVPVNAGLDHWAAGTFSTVSGVPQEAAMDPNLTTGTRKYFTDLDFAGMEDIGWEVAAIPEPGTWALMLSGLLGLAWWSRRRQTGTLFAGSRLG